MDRREAQERHQDNGALQAIIGENLFVTETGAKDSRSLYMLDVQAHPTSDQLTNHGPVFSPTIAFASPEVMSTPLGTASAIGSYGPL